MLQRLHDKVGGSKTAHLRVGSPFLCISLSGNIFNSFFKQSELDEESNTSGFIFFEPSLEGI